MSKRIILYIHSNKEYNYDVGKRNGLSGDALDLFMFAGYEHAMEYDVDEKTGSSVLVSVDGVHLVGR